MTLQLISSRSYFVITPVMANTTKGYIGKIKNGGAQVVQAPNQVKGGKGKSQVTRGKDLRAGK